MRLFLSLIAIPLAAAVVHAAPTFAPVFGKGMVLQRGMAVPVWGKAAPGEEVTVTFLKQSKTATADADGVWRVGLDKLEAGGPYVLTAKGKTEVKIEDVYVGEVWVCSGQSNMRWTLKQSEDGDKEADKADLPLLRVNQAGGAWVTCSPKAAPGFSACAYYFGRDLQKHLKVPVGLIVRCVGGTSARLWTPADAVAGDETLTPFRKAIMEGQAGKDKAAVRKTGSLYDNLIKPVSGYAMKGVIWYQGENDAGRAPEYTVLFPALIRSWRGAWGQGDFPFLYVQLAPVKGGSPGWGPIRQAQTDALSVKNTAMAVINDGDASIHPLKKHLPGTRLALAARALAYGEKVVYSGPLFESFKADGGKATLTFKHVGGGLAAKDGKPVGFELLDESGKAFAAEAAIEGDKVVLTAKGLSKPAGVRYAYSSLAEGTLFNKEGLPASPFRWMPAGR